MTHKTLTFEQLTASKHIKGPSLTLAIPGSGKTTLLLHRLIYLVEEHGVKPSQILTLTFSKASAEDMSTRFTRDFSDKGHRFTFMTIHKFAYGIYRTYLKQTNKTMTLLDDGSKKYQILNEIVKQLRGEALTEDDFETISNDIGLIYNLKLTPETSGGHTFQFEDIFDIARAFHLYKKNHQLFDFDDMLISAIKILNDLPTLLEGIRSKYRFIQVDEAQDTSKLQFELIELLLGEDQNLFLVADDDQSIYGFRGAFPTYLLMFGDRFPSAKLYYLAENFRSDALIVNTAAALIKTNINRYEKAMRPFHPGSKAPSIRTFDDLTGRNTFLMQKLSELSGTTAILYRNKIASLSVLDALERQRLSFQIKDPPIKEFGHWLLEDLLAFLTLAMIPQDLDSFLKVAFKMNGFISREMVNYVKSNHRGRNVFNVLEEIPFLKDFQTRTQERLHAQFDMLQRLRPYDGIHFIETELGYLDYIKSNANRLGLSMNYARTRLDAFKAIAKPLKSGFEFINRVAELGQYLQENVGNSNESIILSTIHGSKGLEFDHVFMIDVNPQIFPGFKATEGDALEEERRLFYVGLTRAKKQFELLHVSFINGSHNPNSLFIEELLRQPITQHFFNNATGKPPTG